MRPDTKETASGEREPNEQAENPFDWRRIGAAVYLAPFDWEWRAAAERHAYVLSVGPLTLVVNRP